MSPFLLVLIDSHSHMPVHTQCFTLVLEGELKVTVGEENLSFPAGPFSTLGIGALSGKKPLPTCDFDAKVR